MQIYKTYAIREGITTVSWQGSQTDASKARAQLKRDGFKAESQTVNVPTAKGPLLDWLNENLKV
jgi:hypothetical protein